MEISFCPDYVSSTTLSELILDIYNIYIYKTNNNNKKENYNRWVFIDEGFIYMETCRFILEGRIFFFNGLKNYNGGVVFVIILLMSEE